MTREQPQAPGRIGDGEMASALPASRPGHATHSRPRAILELSAAAFCVVLRIVLKGTSLAVPVLLSLAAAWGLYFAVRLVRGRSLWRAWGTGWKEARAAAPLHFGVAGAVLALLVAFAWLTDRRIAASPGGLLIYPTWALAQQFALQNVFLAGLRALQVPFVPVVAGAAFGAAHLPDAHLALLAAAGGTLWGALWLARPSLWTLALCHAALGAVAMLVILGQDPAGEFIRALG